MSMEENKAIVRRLNEEVWNKGNLDAVDELVADNFVNHSAPPGMPPDRDGFKQFVAMYRNAFPDTQLAIEEYIAEGDKVATRWSAEGTHRGELMGIPPTGKQVKVTGLSIDRLAGGKVVESWAEFDQMGLMVQLGVVPPPAPG